MTDNAVVGRHGVLRRRRQRPAHQPRTRHRRVGADLHLRIRRPRPPHHPNHPRRDRTPVPTRTITQTWDDDSRPASVTNTGGAAISATYTYDAAGNRTGTSFGNSASETRTFDAAGRLTGVDTRQGPELPGGQCCTNAADPNGNPTKIVRNYGSTLTENYTYDADNRVVKVCSAAELHREHPGLRRSPTTRSATGSPRSSGSPTTSAPSPPPTTPPTS